MELGANVRARERDLVIIHLDMIKSEYLFVSFWGLHHL